MPTRLIIAYALIFILVAGVAAFTWWNMHHSQRRTYERNRTRQERAEAAHAAEFEQEGLDG